jgi:hypothetical protein
MALTLIASPSQFVKQGAILSPLLFCVYYDNLLLALRSKGVGCHVGGFFSARWPAQMILCSSPHASANVKLAHQMLLACDSYSAEFDLSFYAAKSKCLFFRYRNMRRRSSSLEVCAVYQGRQGY